QLNFRPSIPQELAESYFVGAGYDGERRSVYLKLYEPKSQKIHFWYDNTGHTPYCLSKESPEVLGKNPSLVRHPGFVKFERSKRFDALKGQEIPVTVIYARDPLSIGGRPSGCIRDIIDRKSTRLNSSHVAISYAVFCLKKTNPSTTP